MVSSASSLGVAAQSAAESSLLPTVDRPQQLLNNAFQSGQVSRRDYLELTTDLLITTQLSARVRLQINRLLDDILMGRIRFSD